MSAEISVMQKAHELARAGWLVFPCRANKSPACPNGHLDATTDKAEIQRLFGHPAATLIGIPTGQASRIVVVDVDVADGKPGGAWLDENKDRLPVTQTHVTRSGGRHYLFRAPPGLGVRNSVGKLAPGVDIRGDGGYIVYWPSTSGIDAIANAGVYADLPPWILERCSKTLPLSVPDTARLGADVPQVGQDVTSPPCVPLDTDAAVASAALIASKADPAEEGSMSDDAYRLACRMKDEGISAEKCLELMEEHWAPRGVSWPDGELWYRVRNAYRYGENAPGNLHPSSMFADVKIPEELANVKPIRKIGFADVAPFDFGDFEGVEPPPREWLVPAWIPAGGVTMMHGNGGTNKSTLAMQLMASCASGQPWIGLETRRCAVLGLFSEDPMDELHRRQASINKGMHISFADLKGQMFARAPVGEDVRLMKFERNESGPSAVYETLLSEAKKIGAKLVVIDNATGAFGGNQNDASQVRQFLTMLSAMALEIGGAVLLIAHSSRRGMADGEGSSGSVDWRNASRSAMLLERADLNGKKTDDLQSPGRLLTRVKANMAPQGESINLAYDAGLLRRVRPGGGFDVLDGWVRPAAETVFLDLLDKVTATNQPVSTSKNAGNWAPRLFSDMPSAFGYTHRELAAVMMSLMERGLVGNETYGRKSDERRRLVRVRSESK